MTARRKARKRALDVLYEAELRGADPLAVLSRLESEATVPMNPWARTIVEGVVAKRFAIDEVIETYSQGWPLDRMPVVDRCLARIGVYEIAFEESVDDKVTIDEMVSLAAELSTEDSPTFINGLLGRVSSIRHRLTFE